MYASIYFYLLVLMMQTDNFTLKLLALIYIGNKKRKCRRSVLWFERVFVLCSVHSKSYRVVFFLISIHLFES